MQKYVVAAIMLVAFATPALAVEYYVAQDPTTKKCHVVEEKPDGQTMVMIGTEPYATKEDAKAAKKASAECVKKDAN
jgi:hypothetical protein